MERLNTYLQSPNPISGLPPVSWESAGGVEKVYVDDIVAEVPPPTDVMAEARSRMIAGIDGGKTITMFTGHGSTTDWGYGLMTPAIAITSVGGGTSATMSST